jgi:hypothetical protein
MKTVVGRDRNGLRIHRSGNEIDAGEMATVVNFHDSLDLENGTALHVPLPFSRAPSRPCKIAR